MFDQGCNQTDPQFPHKESVLPSRSTLILVSSCISTVSSTPCLWSIPDTLPDTLEIRFSISDVYVDIRAESFGSKVLAAHYRPGVGTNRTADGWFFLQLSYLGEAVMWAEGASGSQV